MTDGAMKLDERTLYLVNGDIDGELTPEEKRELEAILESSAEARAVKAELQRLANLLEGQPDLQPPEDLADTILGQVSLPRQRTTRLLKSGFPSFQPATAGLAFAAGLLMTVAFYELNAPNEAAEDSLSMVGTMVAGQKSQPVQLANTLSIETDGLAGSVSLQELGQFYLVNFDLDSSDPVAVEISFAHSGLSFGGLARTVTGDAKAGESYEVTGGTLRVENQGRQAFTVFLREAVGTEADDREINIGISSGEAQLFSGVLQG